MVWLNILYYLICASLPNINSNKCVQYNVTIHAAHVFLRITDMMYVFAAVNDPGMQSVATAFHLS